MRLDFTVRAGNDAVEILRSPSVPSWPAYFACLAVSSPTWAVQRKLIGALRRASFELAGEQFAVGQRAAAAMADVFNSLRPSGSNARHYGSARRCRVGPRDGGGEPRLNVAVMVLRAVVGHSVSGNLDRWALTLARDW